MSAAELDEQLVDALAPDDAPDDEEIAAHQEDPDTHRLPFAVRDLGSADWAGRKIRKAQAKINEAQRWRDRVVAEADAHLEREKARHEPTIEFFELHLKDWLRREIEADTSKKPRASRDLPCGITVKRTPPGKSLVVEDEDALVDFLTTSKDAEGIATPKWEYSKTDVKNLIIKQGIAVKGARVETGEPGYKVTVGGGS